MTIPDDVFLLRRRLTTIRRTLDQIERQLTDLHVCAYEPATRDGVQVAATRTDYTPRAGDPRAQHLWSRMSLQVGTIESTLIGLHRQITAYFYGGYSSAEPTRGSLISAREHDQLVANQRTRRAAGGYTPAPLIDQPPHPGRRP